MKNLNNFSYGNESFETSSMIWYLPGNID